MIHALREVAARIGDDLLSWREQGGKSGHWEGTQFKAEADARAHNAWVSELAKIAPEIPVLSEEDANGWSGPRPGRYFLIDPIDGTASYAHGFAGFVTQVALIERSTPTCAVVNAPMLKLTWHAVAREGAFLNGKRLQVAQSGDRLLVIDNYPEPRGIAATLVKDLPATGYVECGSIALKACRVADGTADLFVKDVVVRDWDLAPCDLILRETGCTLTDAHGARIAYAGGPEKHGVIAARDAALASRALAILKSATPDSRTKP